MILLKETMIACPKDGHNLFLITREIDAYMGGAAQAPEQLGVVCKHCDPQKFFEVLKNARVIQLDKSPTQKLKV